MTSTTPAASTAPTQPIPPAADDAHPPLFRPGPGTPAGTAPPVASNPPAPRDGTPWYRRVWVLALGAVLLALLSFAGGFVAGNATALFNGVVGVSDDGPAGPGWMDGDRPDGPGFGGRDGFPGQGDGDATDGTTSID